MAPLDLIWPEVLVARVPDMTKELGAGQEGSPVQEEDLLWLWLVLLWRLEDWKWEPPWRPIPSLTLGMAPKDLAWEGAEPLS